jgi:DNA polymerase III gamma/tau subunit
MLILFTFLMLVSVIVATAIWLKKDKLRLLTQNNQENLKRNLRPLFEPTEEDIRAFEREEKQKNLAKIEAEKRQILQDKAENAKKNLEVWRKNPSKLNTVDLLKLASESESSEIYQEIATEIIKEYKNNVIENFLADDLIQLVESHFWLLPPQERTSGVKFWLKEETASLRLESENKLAI